MASLCNIVTRGLISLFHISISLAAGSGVVYTLAKWGSETDCLPPMVQASKKVFKMKAQVPDLCVSIFTCLIIVAFLNLAMCALVNCVWKYANRMFMLVHLVITLAVAGFSVFVASSMSMYTIIWCDSLIQAMSTNLDIGCSAAATLYVQDVDSRNVTRYYERLETEMLGLWALVPLTVIIIFLYGIAMSQQHASHSTTEQEQQDTSTPQSSATYDESTHLLVNNDSPNNYTSDSSAVNHGSQHDV